MRKLKMLGVAAIAVFAMSAVASAASAAEFTAQNYPAAGTATSSADVFTAFGANVECTNNTFEGTLAAQSPTLNITPKYTSCHAFGVFPATVTTSANNYTFHSNNGGSTGTVDVNSAITINVYESAAKHEANEPMCIVTVPGGSENENLGPVTYTNNADGTVTVSGTVEGITATQVRKSIFCPSGTTTNSATYAIQPAGITIAATNEEGGADPVDVK